VDPQQQLRDVEGSSTLKFFVNVQGKTKLETNLQSASLLPHYNTFEARALRVVISDLPPEFPDDPVAPERKILVTDRDGKFFMVVDGMPHQVIQTTPDPNKAITAKVKLSIGQLAELFREAKSRDDRTAELDVREVVLSDSTGSPLPDDRLVDEIFRLNGSVKFLLEDIEENIDNLGKTAPPIEQLNLNNGSGTVIGKFVYNTVTSFIVGEKTMISMPTWFFPSGAGPYSQTGVFTTHGEPSPLATFRFAEPIYIDKQQNFRAEIEIPHSDTLKEIQQLYGPFKLWVVVDGYLTRDVQ